MGLNHLRSTSPPEQLVVHDLLAPHSRALTHVLEHDRHLCSGHRRTRKRFCKVMLQCCTKVQTLFARDGRALVWNMWRTPRHHDFLSFALPRSICAHRILA